jgi:hypothetical protein
MNLGMVQQVIEQHAMSVATVVEDQLDEQLHRLENLDEDDLERIRQSRIDQLKRQKAKKEKWLANGHGEVQDLLDEKVRVHRVPVRPCESSNSHSLTAEVKVFYSHPMESNCLLQ